MRTTYSLDDGLSRLRDEFVCQPALALTVPQIARLLGIRPADAEAIAERLEDEGWLMRSTVGVYRRVEPALS